MKPEFIPWIQKSEMGVSCKIRNDYSDFDYKDKLSVSYLKFLKAFNREYYNADFSHKHRNLHFSKKERKICYDANNARNKCVYARSKVRGELWLFRADTGVQSIASEDNEEWTCI